MYMYVFSDNHVKVNTFTYCVSAGNYCFSVELRVKAL